MSLKLQSGRPDTLIDVHPQLHMYLHPGCTYRLVVSISWTELYGQVRVKRDVTVVWWCVGFVYQHTMFHTLFLFLYRLCVANQIHGVVQLVWLNKAKARLKNY